jgi:septal ring factor EnvC (AmiA/AmiB activator)
MPDATPEQLAAFKSLKELCLGATRALDGQLMVQKKTDAIAKKRREDEENTRREQERLAADKAEKDRLETVRKLDKEQAAIEAAECELAAKKKAVQDAQKDIAKKAPFNVQGEAADDKGDDKDEDEDEDENEDDRSESPVSHDIRPSTPCSAHCTYFY